MKIKILSFLLFCIAEIFFCCCLKDRKISIITAPAGNKYTQIDKNGTTVLPNGRILTPAGKSIMVAPHPYGLTLSRDGALAVTANSGTNPLSITIIRDILSNDPSVQQVPPGPVTDKEVLASVFMGLAISPDKKIVYVSGGQENKIYIFDSLSGENAGFIDCATPAPDDRYMFGYIGDMALSTDGKTLYAVDQINFEMLVVNTYERVVTHRIPVGRYPFGITLSRDGVKAYVANVGMYEYKKIRRKQNEKDIGLGYPPFAYLSGQALNGINNDSVFVPALGDPNVPESFSVWTIDLKINKVSAKIKTGNLVGQKIERIPAVGGSSPNSLAATSDYIFVSNGNNDNISVIDVKKDTVVKTIYLKPHPLLVHFRGVIPFGLAVSPDEKRLYVAESGINAVGVIDIPALKVMGHIPVGWFPSKLRVTPDGKKLIVANAKGFGSGPNGGKNHTPGPEGTYIGSIMKGTVSVLDIPADKELKRTMEKVITNNFAINPASSAQFDWRRDNPVPLYPGQKQSPVKHIIFVSKENRTFDEVFGQLSKADGDSSLARYGSGVSFQNRAKTSRVQNATVMANHLNLACRFSISDNFYVDSDVSADGHRWLVNTYPNEWVETTTPASYGDNRNFRQESKAPGSLSMNGAAGAIYPEDYNEAGSMWEHLQRHNINFYNFGFGIMFEPALYDEYFKYTGIRHLYNFPVPAPMYDKTSKTYPTYNMAIPDQFRVDMFIREFNKKWGGAGDTLPPVLTIILPNDHGAGERPDAGYPYRESYMADNDLALGRVVEFLSRTCYWKNMAIFVTEDDAQNGVDHIDAHRSILMLISPYAKKDYVGHVHYSFSSISKTFWNILGIPYLNQYDAGATDMADMFTNEPDFTPYNALPADPRIFEPQKALDPFDENFDWHALNESPKIDDPEDMLNESKEQDRFRLENREKE